MLQPAGVLQFEGEHGWWGVVGEHFDDTHGERKRHLTCDLHNAPVEQLQVNLLRIGLVSYLAYEAGSSELNKLKREYEAEVKNEELIT